MVVRGNIISQTWEKNVDNDLNGQENMGMKCPHVRVYRWFYMSQ